MSKSVGSGLKIFDVVNQSLKSEAINRGRHSKRYSNYFEVMPLLAICSLKQLFPLKQSTSSRVRMDHFVMTNMK